MTYEDMKFVTELVNDIIRPLTERIARLEDAATRVHAGNEPTQEATKAASPAPSQVDLFSSADEKKQKPARKRMKPIILPEFVGTRDAFGRSTMLRIFKLLKLGSPSAVAKSDIAKGIGCSLDTVNDYLRALVHAGLAESGFMTAKSADVSIGYAVETIRKYALRRGDDGRGHIVTPR